MSGLFAPIGGVLGDRFDRKRVMIVSDLAGAACFVAMAFVHDPALADLAVGFVAAIVETPFWSASAAAIPNLVGKDDLAWANGLIQVGANAGIMVGPAIGGRACSPRSVRASCSRANAFSFVVSAALVLDRAWPVRRGARRHDHEHEGFRAGFVFIARDRVLRTLVLAWSAFVLGLGIVMVADVPLAELFGAGATGYGLMIGAFGAGSVIGSLAGRRLTTRTEARALFAGTIVIGITTAGVALSPWFAPVLVLILVSGVADAVVMMADRNIQQRRTPDVVRSRVVSASEAIIDDRVVDRVRPRRSGGRAARTAGVLRDRRCVLLDRRRRARADPARVPASAGGAPWGGSRTRARHRPASRELVRTGG